MGSQAGKRSLQTGLVNAGSGVTVVCAAAYCERMTNPRVIPYKVRRIGIESRLPARTFSCPLAIGRFDGKTPARHLCLTKHYAVENLVHAGKGLDYDVHRLTPASDQFFVGLGANFANGQQQTVDPESILTYRVRHFACVNPSLQSRQIRILCG